MTLPAQIAQHYRTVFFGGNWTEVNLLEVLANVTWQQATTRVEPLNTIHSLADWQNLLTQAWANAEAPVRLIEQLPEPQLAETFISEQYGPYYRNLHGAIEHAHYPLGQIVVVKKLLQSK